MRFLYALAMALTLVLTGVACQDESEPQDQGNEPNVRVQDQGMNLTVDEDKASSSTVLRYDAEEYTKEFVLQAVEMHREQGLDDTVAYYNTPESIDGQWYVFIFEDDKLLAHADQSLVGLPAHEVKSPNGYPAGEAVLASADEDGEWLSYLFTNPVSGAAEIKHTWVVDVDGVQFGSGWYESSPDKWDTPAYTKAFVQQAVDLYRAVGLERTLEYYNTPESVDGQWYVYILDEDLTLVASPLTPQAIGVPAVAITGPNNFPVGLLGTDVDASAGVWVDYRFPNPAVDGEVELKHVWAVEYDDVIFASGWYEPLPGKADAPAYTKAFVQQAIDLYDAAGIEKTAEYYNTPESVDGQWYVFIIDTETGRTIVHFNEELRDRDPSERIDSQGYFYGDDLLAVSESGTWVDYWQVNPETGEDVQKHTWAVLHDNLIFSSGWYE
ncbi:MAG: hypothetical protein OXI96_08430 [Acidimicrobiaceae bacterium]|nr:hypothetical protein [Acidimicrobiaceae bacterium]